jgi:hypothetical protein
MHLAFVVHRTSRLRPNTADAADAAASAAAAAAPHGDTTRQDLAWLGFSILEQSNAACQPVTHQLNCINIL